MAHLAGGLGKTVWTLLPFVPDWRWRQQGAGTPWYPTMRLYRQPRCRDWGSVLAQVAEDLVRFADERRCGQPAAATLHLAAA